jgi:hypothetical protein
VGEPEAFEPSISPPPIGVNLGSRPDPPSQVAEEGTPPPIPNDAQSHSALIIDNTQNPYLGVDAADAVLAPAVYGGLIHMDDASGIPDPVRGP